MSLDMTMRIALICVMLFAFSACAPERNCDPDTFIHVRGRVWSVNTGEAVPNADVHIETLAGERGRCPEFPTDFSADLLTDENGYFDLNNSAQGFAHFSLSINAEGCQAYSYEGVFFTFENEAARTFGIYCPNE